MSWESHNSLYRNRAGNQSLRLGLIDLNVYWWDARRHNGEKYLGPDPGWKVRCGRRTLKAVFPDIEEAKRAAESWAERELHRGLAVLAATKVSDTSVQ